MMRYLLLIVIYCCTSWQVQAEQTLDSLQQQLVNAKDTDKPVLLLKLANTLQYSDAEQAETYALQAKHLATQIQDFTHAAEAAGMQAQLRTQTGDFAKAQPLYEEALEHWKALNNESKIVSTQLELGNVYWRMGDYDKALTQCYDALKRAEALNDNALIADAVHQLGIINDLLGNYTVALEHHHRALELREALDDKEGIADSLNNIGIVHYFSGKFKEALENYMKSLDIRRAINDAEGIAKSLNNVGLAFKGLKQYDEALSYFEQAIQMREKLGDKYEVANISNNIADLYNLKKDFDAATPYLIHALQLATETDSKELVRENYELFSKLYAAQNDFHAALAYYKLSTEVKDSILNEQSQEAIADMQTKYETEKKEQQIALQQLALNQQALLRNSLMGGLFFIVILAFVMFNRYRFEKKTNQKLEEANNLISLEKEKSDQLLLNILPLRVANDLKETGKTEPESFENVTVYFSDVVGFTDMSSQLEPKFLIDELNDIFTAFDNIVESHQCERVKTIGDAYLCVCGMPTPDPHHAQNIVRSATEIIQYMNERNQRSDIQWRIRIGIHTGSVVGGVVGVKKYIYDVFGDSINTASRMESNSEPMRINISQTTYELVKDQFSITPRGSMFVKGKGDMNMYFVDV